MKIDNKFEIGETVMFGHYQTKIIGIVVFPEGFAYKLSYLDGDDKYVIVEVYEFEINKYDGQGLGFKKL